MSWRAIRCITLLTILSACTTDPEEVQRDPSSGVVAEESPAGDELIEERPLSPRVRAVGPARSAPAQVVVYLSRELFEDIGEVAPPGNVLEITPPIDGELIITGASTLDFIPSRPFRPDTEYTATLRSLAAGDQSWSGDWERVFQTPEFELIRVSVHDHILKSDTAALDLIWSAPIDLQSVRRRLSITQAGAEVQIVEVIAGDRPEEARVRLAGLSRQREIELEVLLDAGTRWAGGEDIEAPASEQKISLGTGPAMEILSVSVKEGLSGHYIDVVCKDDAVAGERYWWDEDTWDGWWVSTRCQLSAEEVARTIHTTPHIDLTVSPSAAGFRIFGDLEQGLIELKIDGGAETLDGGRLPKTWLAKLRVPARSARLSFADKGRYLPRDAWDRLPLRHLNISSAELTVRHIPEQNLVFWLGGQERASSRTSDIVLRETLPLPSPVDLEDTTWIDVGAMLPEVGRGVYELRVASDDTSDAARILLSDLQIVAKTSAPKPDAPWGTSSGPGPSTPTRGSLPRGSSCGWCAPAGRPWSPAGPPPAGAVS